MTEKLDRWIVGFAARDWLTLIMFSVAAIVLLLRYLIPERFRRAADLVLGGLYCVAFVLVTAFFRPTL